MPQIDPNSIIAMNQILQELSQLILFIAAGIGLLVFDKVIQRVGQLSAWAEMKFSKDGKPNETAGFVAQVGILAGSALLAAYFSM